MFKKRMGKSDLAMIIGAAAAVGYAAAVVTPGISKSIKKNKPLVKKKLRAVLSNEAEKMEACEPVKEEAAVEATPEEIAVETTPEEAAVETIPGESVQAPEAEQDVESEDEYYIAEAPADSASVTQEELAAGYLFNGAEAEAQENQETKVDDAKTSETEGENYLKKNYELLRKQNRILKWILASTFGMFLVFLVCAILVTPHVLNILVEGENTLARIETEMAQFEKIERIIDDVSVMTQGLIDADIPGLIEETKSLVDDSGNGIADAVGKMDSIDIRGLNEAIEDLNVVVGKMRTVLRL